MAIYRGIGGAGDSNTDATVTAVTEQATNAQTSANNAATSATSAASSASAASSSATQAANSATASATSATNSSTSATNAANSAAAAANSATEAGVSAINAASSEASVAANATAAATSETNAATSATNAATSATNAATSATTATTKASEASSSAASASTSASTATTKANEASTSATNAATSETNAATSASNAATSATNAATSETNAASSASTASTQATAASASAATASTQAANAATSATNSANSATASATSASNAATSETNAANSATAAASSATSAASSASSASTSASTATAAKDAALAALDSFDDRYLGTKTSDPTVDNDGNPLVAGALYFNTTDDVMKVYEGSAWVAAYASLSGAVLETGGTMSGNLAFGDNNKAIFGAGSDLQIYHDGLNSYISDTGTGRLNIQSGTSIVIEGANGDNFFSAVENAEAALYYDNAIKLATTSTGIDVTGTATMDGLEIDVTRSNTAGSGFLTLDLIGTGGDFAHRVDTSNAYYLDYYTGAAWRPTVKIEGQTGDISFYEDTGTTAKFFWDASAEQLQLTGSGGLTVDGVGDFRKAVGAGQDFSLSVTDTTAGKSTNVFRSGASYSYAGIGSQEGALYTYNSNLNIVADGGDIKLNTGSAGASAERMRITSAGNVGIGTSSPSAKLEIDGNTSTDGILITNPLNGSFYNAKLEFKRDSTSGGAKIQTERNAAGGVGLSFNYTASNTAEVNGTYSEAMRIDSAGNVGIGTSSPSRKLSINDASAPASLQLQGPNGGYVEIAASNAVAGKESYIGTQFSILDSGSTTDLLHYTGTGNNQLFYAGATERMRLDSSGNLLVGKTALSRNVAGVQLEASGAVTGVVDGDVAGYFNRQSTDGDIVQFRKDGTTVGSIGVNVGDLTIGTGDTGILFHNGLQAVFPLHPTAGTSKDGQIDLGTFANRFKDLYLSGGLKGDTLTFSSNAGTERARIDSSGKLGVGTSSPNAAYAISTGSSGGGLLHTPTASAGGTLIRMGSPSQVQYLVANYYGNVTFRTSDNGAGINLSSSNNALLPGRGSMYYSPSNGDMDLGVSTNRWRDLYLSGTLNTPNITDGTNTTSTTNVVKGSAKAWVKWQGTGTVTVLGSSNVSSVTDNGTGLYTVNFSTSMNSVHYSAQYTGYTNVGANNRKCDHCIRSYATSSVAVGSYGSYSSGPADQSYCSVTVHGN